MSRHDEFKDLEKRLRQARPSTEPLPPAQKRQLRAQLLEKATMNEEKVTPGRILAAVGAIVLLVGIPLLFWITQSSLNQNQPMAPSIAEATKTPPAMVKETTAVPEATFTVPPTVTPYAFAWIVSMDPAPGTTLMPQDTVNVTVGYDLQSVVAEAQLLVKLVTDENEGVGVGTGETTVSQNRGTATISVTLENLEALADGDEVSLHLVLAHPGGEQRLFLAMPEEFHWPVSTATAEAAIISVSEPVLRQPPGEVPEDVSFYEIEIAIEYTLTGYPEATMLLRADYDGPQGRGSTEGAFTILEGSDVVTTTMMLANNHFAEDGTLLPETTLSVTIDRYDAEAGEYVNLYPGGIEPSPGLAGGPPPGPPDLIRINTITLDESMLNISLSYHLESSPTATLTLDNSSETAVSEPMTVTAGDDGLTLPIPANVLQPGTPLTITAVLEGDGVQLSDTHTLRRSDFENDTPEDLWIAHVDVITGTNVPENNALFQVTLGYHLSEAFSSGKIRNMVQHQTSGPNGGGGGGGGGGQPLPTGTGIVTIPIYVPLSALEENNDVTVSILFELTGTAVTDTGSETQTLSTLTPTLDELLPNN